MCALTVLLGIRKWRTATVKLTDNMIAVLTESKTCMPDIHRAMAKELLDYRRKHPAAVAVVEAFDDLLGLVEHCADFRNGATYQHIDEGQVRAAEFIEKLRKVRATYDSVSGGEGDDTHE